MRRRRAPPPELVAGGLIRLGAVGIPVGSGTWLAAPTILAHGPDELRDYLLAPILTGEQTWCQLFSEPGAGSDLAGLSTSAVLDGDSWVINGQKVWNCPCISQTWKCGSRAAGARPGAEGSIGKLAASNIARESAKVHSMIATASALLTGPDSPFGGIIAEALMSVPGQSIAGGTDEIQKNILAEKVLGLPAEIRADRNVPFSQLKHRG